MIFIKSQHSIGLIVDSMLSNGEQQQSRRGRLFHSRPRVCCPAAGALSGAPPPENAAPRSAAGSTLAGTTGRKEDFNVDFMKKYSKSEMTTNSTTPSSCLRTIILFVD